MPIKSQTVLPFYNSKNNDLIEEFYIPLLSNCTRYDRVSAFFDSRILKLYSLGIENIVNSNGHIRFIFSSQLSEEDFNLIKSGYEEKEKIERRLADGLLLDDSPEISNLAYLISRGFVDIKIAFTKKGILHDKFGLIVENNDVVYFRGSNNETVAAIENNYESFETSTSWNADDNEKKKIENASREFEKLWNNTADGTIVMDFPQVIKDKILVFNKNELILTYENKENCFVFDLNDKEYLIGINNLINPMYLLPPTMWYLGYISYYVTNNPSLENKTYLFREDMNYIDMQKIIALIGDKGKEKGFDIYVSPKLRRFFIDKDIQAEKRRSLGIGIKQKAPIVVPSFNEFCDVVNTFISDRPLRLPQLWDAFHIARMKRAANFSVPGAGKTSIVYGAFAYLLAKGLVNKIVMVGPLNSFLAWKNEFGLNFGDRIQLKYFDYHQHTYRSDQERFDGIRNDTKGKNLVLINYESVQMNIEALKSIIDSKTLLVFDEVHRIKSTTGKRAAACLEISKKANYKVVLTGTPIPNGYKDIYNFLHILFPDEYNEIFDFDEKFLVQANKNEEKQNQINSALYPFFCRTTKKDLKVPMPEEDDITTGYCEFDEKFEHLLELVYRECGYNFLLLYIRLLQASTNPSLVVDRLTEEDIHSLDIDSDEKDQFDFSNFLKTGEDKEEYSLEEQKFIRSFDMTPKFYKTIDLTNELVLKGNQVVIWGIFIRTIYKTKEELRKRGISCEVITGGTPLEEREDIIGRFIRGEFDVLITNPHTLAESVSLHKNCHHAIYMEYSFNLVHMLQSRDRIHRLGLKDTDKTFYYYMMMDNPDFEFNTIDRKVYDRLKIKEEIQNAAVEGEDLIYVEDDYKEDIENLLKEI